MKVNTEYICDICKAKYNNEKDALQCEANHSLCHCKKDKNYSIYYSIVGYGQSMCGFVNFENSTIDIHLNDDDSICRQNVTKIKFCPFCGDKL